MDSRPGLPLSAALAADRGLRRRAAREAFEIPGGLVVRDDDLYDVHYLNAVILDGGAAGGTTGAAALADAWLGERDHRHVVFDDERAGEAAAAELAPAGWERRRTLFMAFAGDAGATRAPVADPRARPVDDAQIDALQLAALREEVPAAAARWGLGRRLAATQRALRAGTPARCFAAGESRGLHSMCTLFLDADANGLRVATIQEVTTLAAHRGRGLARAVVSAAVAAAHDWGADLVAVAADADDWPQLMYARLGFEAIGRQVSVTLRQAPRRGGGPVSVRTGV